MKTKIKKFIEIKWILFTIFIITIIYVILLLLTILKIILIDYMVISIDIGVIFVALLTPLLLNDLEKRKKKVKLLKIYQICFKFITIICKNIVNNELDKKVFSHIKILAAYKEKLIKLNTVYNEIELRATNNYIKVIINLLEQELEINLGIDINSAMPVHSSDYNYIKIRGDQTIDKREIKLSLDDFRKKYNLHWDDDILSFFNS